MDGVDRPGGRVASSSAASGTPAVGPLSEDPLEHFRSGKRIAEEKAILFLFGVVSKEPRGAQGQKRELDETNACSNGFSKRVDARKKK